MHTQKTRIARAIGTLFITAALSACLGGGGGGGSSGGLSGTASGVAATGLAIANASITAKGANGSSKTTSTDANGSFSLALSTGATYLPLGFVPMTLLLEPAGMTSPIALPLDGAGSFSTPLPVPPDPQYIGMSIFLQTFAVDALGVTASNALETKICP